MSWVEIAVGAASSGTAATVIVGIALRLLRHPIRSFVEGLIDPKIAVLDEKFNKRFDKNDEATRENGKLTAELRRELDTQFGGNGGGMRQAINSMGVDIAHLNGRFEQHIKEGCR